MLYNKYKSVVSYKTTTIPVFSMDTVSKSEKIDVYDSIDSDVLQSYMEFSLASLLYYAMKVRNIQTLFIQILHTI